MRKQKSGVIAQFGSLVSWRGVPAGGIYCATKWAVSALTETIRGEVAPLGIEVCCIEPGFFRTGFLHPGARIDTETRLQDYDDTIVGQMRAMFTEKDNKQLGDTEKGCKVMFDVLTKKDGKKIPERLPLGSDAYAGIKEKCDETKELLEVWKDVICSTDHDD